MNGEHRAPAGLLDAGALLLRATDRAIGMTFAIALGYEDFNAITMSRATIR